jgi:hypothetical protein
MPRKSSETIDPQLDEEELLRVEGFKCRKKSKGKSSENKNRSYFTSKLNGQVVARGTMLEDFPRSISPRDQNSRLSEAGSNAKNSRAHAKIRISTKRAETKKNTKTFMGNDDCNFLGAFFRVRVFSSHRRMNQNRVFRVRVF